MTFALQIIVASTTIFLAAGRFGLTPSANRLATPGLKLVGNDSGLKTADPAGNYQHICKILQPHERLSAKRMDQQCHLLGSKSQNLRF